MKITELLKEHNLEAQHSYNTAEIRVFEGTKLAFSLPGSELAQDMTPEGTEKLVRKYIEEYESSKKNNG